MEKDETEFKKPTENWVETSIQKESDGTSLAVQWLRLHAFTAGDVGSIPGQGTKIPYAGQPKDKNKTKQRKGR